jgi:hypothetical protein
MGRWFQGDFDALIGPAERRELPPSVQQIRIDDNAIWQDLCDEDAWKPLSEWLQALVRVIRTPQSFDKYTEGGRDWTILFLHVVFEIERLHYVLLARQLAERIRDLTYDEPLPSLLHGLDVAVASALETGRLLNLEMSEAVDEAAPDAGTDDVEELPEWGRGYAFVLYRRFVADAQSVLDLLAAVCREAYADEDYS